jgi:hypothetical protein
MFLLRINTAILPNNVLTSLNNSNFKEDVLYRLKAIEDYLRISIIGEAELD